MSDLYAKTVAQKRDAALLAAGSLAPDLPIGHRSIGFYDRDSGQWSDPTPRAMDEDVASGKIRSLGGRDPILYEMTEIDAVNAIVAAQKAAGDPIDSNGARRFIRYLLALGLLHFP